ncbi:hypothetical protein QEG98_25590 [Myxococcus sp. MxC21-1]|uniref:tetratricopeptide repeat protein n=1 Tax=Myxococcus sp. MxC21-1 TaxID=3041439 RepID=UPI00292DEB7E|nr:hypothetical protein [Myxococcus sp. MxC21-1]WNZ59431.1 hypothetical protein QEG98_25590 [Myxococcus sp. MxC21-1]
MGLFFLRKLRYALHDFHHLLPRVVSRWQSLVLGLLLLSLPWVLGLGVLPALLVMLATVSLYLSRKERVVAAVLVAGVGLLPLAAGQLARVTAFAGTPAEDVYLLERGGLSAEEARARVLARMASRSATFAEVLSLAYFESRRGLLEEARTHFKAASALKSSDARLLTRFGNTLVALGDAEGAALLYVQASQSAPDRRLHTTTWRRWSAAGRRRCRTRRSARNWIAPPRPWPRRRRWMERCWSGTRRRRTGCSSTCCCWPRSWGVRLASARGWHGGGARWRRRCRAGCSRGFHLGPWPPRGRGAGGAAGPVGLLGGPLEGGQGV